VEEHFRAARNVVTVVQRQIGAMLCLGPEPIALEEEILDGRRIAQRPRVPRVGDERPRIDQADAVARAGAAARR
jgi:hypothetical protein